VSLFRSGWVGCMGGGDGGDTANFWREGGLVLGG